MKKKIILLCLCATLLTGCSLDFIKPEMEKPQAQYDSDMVDNLIKEIPYDYQLTLPRNVESASAINFIDFNNDGIDEVVTIMKNINDTSKVRVQVYESFDGRYNTKRTIDIEGDIIALDFFTIDSKRHNAMSVLSENKEGDRSVEVFILENGSIQSIGSKEAERVVVTDLNDDGVNDLIGFRNSDNSEEVIIDLFEFSDNKFNIKDSIAIQSQGEIGDITVSDGLVNEDTKGLLLNLEWDSKTTYTELILEENGKLKKVFSTGTDAPITATDSKIEAKNKDGILQIGIATTIESELYADTNNIQPEIIQWYEWDGYKGLTYTHDMYREDAYNIEIDIPSEWDGKYIVEENPWASEKYIFFYNIENGIKEEIFRVVIVDTEDWGKYAYKLEEGKRKYTYLDQNSKYRYVAFVNEEVSNGDIDAESIREMVTVHK